jgi:lipopolysaccharide export system permease protein
MLSGPLVTRLDRYIFRQLGIALVAVTGGLAVLIWLTQSLRFVELVVNRGLSIGVFLQLTGLLLPSFIAVIVPITTFVVVQFVYQRLAGDRELTVMRSTGLSPFGLARPALALAVLAMGAGYLLNVWIVPASLNSFREFQWEIRNQVAAFLLQEGVFTAISDDLTVYVRFRDREGVLRGIVVDDARQPNAHATILAERGRLVDGPTGPRVLLQNGSRQEIDRLSGRLKILTFNENAIDLAEATHGDAARPRDMTEASLAELFDPHPANAQDIGKWRAEADRRLAAPWSTLSFAMVALLSVLTGSFRRFGGMLRPVIAIGAIVALLAVGLAVGNLAARDNRLIPLIWVQAILPGLVCAAALFVPQIFTATGRRGESWRGSSA